MAVKHGVNSVTLSMQISTKGLSGLPVAVEAWEDIVLGFDLEVLCEGLAANSLKHLWCLTSEVEDEWRFNSILTSLRTHSQTTYCHGEGGRRVIPGTFHSLSCLFY